MKTKHAVAIAITAIVICAVCSFVNADYGVVDKGIWPESWPKELEPLRKQSKTYEGPIAENRHYLISFSKREQFEAAWPHILKVKPKGAPIVLVKASKEAFFAVKPAGVVIHTPPIGTPDDQTGKGLLSSFSIVLSVDGDVVDLNRIPLPADTPIIDERFKEEKKEGKKDEKKEEGKKAPVPAPGVEDPADAPAEATRLPVPGEPGKKVPDTKRK